MAHFAKAQWQDVPEYDALELHVKSSQDAKYLPVVRHLGVSSPAWQVCHTVGTIKRAGLPIPFSERGCSRWALLSKSFRRFAFEHRLNAHAVCVHKVLVALMGHLPRLRYGKNLSGELRLSAHPRGRTCRRQPAYLRASLPSFSPRCSPARGTPGTAMGHWSRPWYADNQYLNTHLILFT